MKSGIQTKSGNVQKIAYQIFFLLIAGSSFAVEVGNVELRQLKGYKFPEEMLIYNIQTAKGSQFDRKIVDEDIKRLYSTGNFSDILTETETLPDGKISVVFLIKSKPRIKDIIIQGNKKFKSDKLVECITLEKNGPLNDSELKNTLTKLREFYDGKGYLSATFAPETKKIENSEDDVNLIININEDLRKKVSSVTFTGNTVFSAWTLKNSLATQHSYWSCLFNIGLLNESEFDIDKDRLRELYWEKGYLDFKVLNIELEEDPEDPEYYKVIFHLDEGEPYTVNQIVITGNENVPVEDIYKTLKLKSNSTFNYLSEKADKKNIANLYYPLGYADFHCDVIRLPDLKNHTVNIEYKITEGPQYTVRDLNISGNRNTKDYVIRREMAIQPGDPVDKNRIEASKARLMGMNYFDKVDIVSVGTDEPNTKDLNVEVTEKDTWKFSIGAGISDTDSLVGMIQISQINFDLFDPANYFTGGGQRLDIRAQYGIERSDFSINFSEPWLFDIPLRLDVSGFYHDREYKDWSEQRAGGRIGFTRRFLEFNSISLGYTLESVRVYDMDKNLSEKFQDQKGRNLVSRPSIEIARDTRDRIIEPTSGYLLSLYGDIGPRFFGSSVNTYRTEAKASHYISVFENSLTLHTGIKMGQTGPFGTDDMVPIYDRYFLGGTDSIRGFPYRSISPVDSNKDPYGGQSMLLANVELTHPIWRFIRGAVFTDIGNVWENSWDMNLGGLNMGIGYGLRIKVPYINAPVQLDLAYPIINKQKGVSSKLRFHFNMGFAWSP